MGAPTRPIEFGTAEGSARIDSRRVEAAAVLDRLRSACSSVTTEHSTLRESSRDWWPLAMAWALDGDVGGLAAALCRPASVAEVADVVRICNEARVPVTPAAGRSGVCGGSVPVHGGVVLDLTGLQGIRSVDGVSLTADVWAGTFGDELEAQLRTGHGATLGHWPQSMSLSTVGGWLACRSAGQYSTRYGKIEDLVVGLDVVLADGTQLTTGGSPRSAVGPDLNQLFVGSEGTLGVITGARLRLHPAPAAEVRAAYGFASFDAGLAACRAVVQAGATPAVLRLYDAAESARSHGGDGSVNVLLVLDEGDPAVIGATMAVVARACVAGEPLADSLVDRWLEHRNDVSALEALTTRGYVVDTMEVAGPWAVLEPMRAIVVEAMLAVPHARSCTVHQSHAYTDGACLYFTFAATPPPQERSATYVALWDAGQRAALAAGGALSHHHGIGLNRARFVRSALGAGAHDVLAAMKRALDPNGILNPGKLGLPSPYGEVNWP